LRTIVPQCSGKSHVALAELEVRFANPGLDDAYDDVITAGRPECRVGTELQRLIKYDGAPGELFRYVDPHVVEVAGVVK